MKSDLIRIKDNTEVQNMIITKIKDLINYKNLEPGDKLPSERVLSEKFKVGRRSIREAIEKLEYYELVKSIPQTGTFVANIGQIALNGMIDDIIQLKKPDFISLVETRVMLELKTVSLAAQRRTEEDLENIEESLNNYKKKTLNGEDALQEDLLFHLEIAKACGNSTINDLMLQITPKIISVFEKTRVCDEDGFQDEVQKHEVIFEAIKNQNPQKAVAAMEHHFQLLIDFCKTYK